MALNLSSHTLSSSSLRGGRFDREDINPMESVANMVDVMLVFACGLMMALVAYWNIDVSGYTELKDTDMQPIDQPEEIADQMTSAGSSYVERGVVYQDPNTGKYYLLSQDGDLQSDSTSNGASSSTSSGSSSASTSTSSSNASSGSSSAGSSDGAIASNRASGAD